MGLARLWAPLAVVFVLVVLVPPSPAGAQVPAPEPVDISFDLGPFDGSLGDWPVTAVKVQGNLTEGEEFTVELRGSGGTLLWSATASFVAPVTRIEVAGVTVRAVTWAGLSQAVRSLPAAEIDRPEINRSTPGTGGSGQLALSMVLAVIIVAVIFRTPLPSASTQRWTR